VIRLRGFQASIVAPLAALLGCTILAIVLAGQAGLAVCSYRVVVTAPAGAMSGMPGMHDMRDMPGMHDMPDVPRMHDMPGMIQGLSICPVVLGLILLAAAAICWAFLVLRADRDRGYSRRRLLGVVARLPFGATVLAVSAAATLPLAVIVAGEPSAQLSFASLAAPAASVLGASLAITALIVGLTHLLIALGRRFAFAIAARFVRRVSAVLRFERRPVSAATSFGDVCALAARRGLRAPPPFVH
jgi:hypothetical protein